MTVSALERCKELLADAKALRNARPDFHEAVVIGPKDIHENRVVHVQIGLVRGSDDDGEYLPVWPSSAKEALALAIKDHMPEIQARTVEILREQAQQIRNEAVAELTQLLAELQEAGA